LIVKKEVDSFKAIHSLISLDFDDQTGRVTVVGKTIAESKAAKDALKKMVTIMSG
jgi:hypothetical protein